MSETSNLAQRLKEQKQRENEITQNLMKQQLDDMRKELTSILKSELSTIKADTQAQSQSIGWAMLRSRLLWPFVIGLSLCIGILGGSWGAMHYFTTKAVSLSHEITAMNKNIETLEAEGGKINFNRCGDSARLCVKVNTKAGAYGEKSQWRILEGY